MPNGKQVGKQAAREREKGLKNVEAEGKTPAVRARWIFPLRATLLRTLILELAPTLLPIGVIYLVRRLTISDTQDVLLWPEWSFAAIILFAAALSKMIDLKTHYQHDTSYRLEAASRLLGLLQVAAVITLSAAILAQGRHRVDIAWLANLNLLLIGIAASTILIVEWAIQQRYYLFRSQPWRLSRGQYYKGVVALLESLAGDLDNLAYILSTANQLKRASGSEYEGSRIWTEEMRRVAHKSLQRIEESARTVRTRYLPDIERSIDATARYSAEVAHAGPHP